MDILAKFSLGVIKKFYDSKKAEKIPFPNYQMLSLTLALSVFVTGTWTRNCSVSLLLLVMCCA